MKQLRWAALAAMAMGAMLLAGCEFYDSAVYGGRPGVVERPGSGSEADRPTIYVVQRGDTLQGIGQRFGVPEATIAERNSLRQPYKLNVGQWLEIPTTSGGINNAGVTPSRPGGTVQSAPLPPPPGTSASPPASGAPTNVNPASGGANPPLSAAPPVPPVPNQAAAPPAATQPGRAPKFDWPVRGQILARFGAKPGGVTNDGIDIAAPRGTPVKAAEAGAVVYAGDEVKGFGKLVLIAHADGYVTAYAYNDELLVTKGKQVAKGETIAKVGQSGGVAQPQLHFEIRQRNKAIDPAPLLPQ